MPNLYLIGGPNGAGKTTVAFEVFPQIIKSNEFVNADFISKGLSAFNTESVAMTAGRLMLRRLHDLRSWKKDFAFESTLASRSFVPFLKECKSEGYDITVMYIWIESPEIAVERVRKRVQEGGHSIPDAVVRRRFDRSVSNLVNLYIPLADKWKIYDNTYAEPRLIATKESGEPKVVLQHRMDRIMSYKVQEPQVEYIADAVDLAVKSAIAKELERKRKLGLPIVFGKDGKVIVMVGDNVIEERPYSQQANEEDTPVALQTTKAARK